MNLALVHTAYLLQWDHFICYACIKLLNDAARLFYELRFFFPLPIRDIKKKKKSALELRVSFWALETSGKHKIKDPYSLLKPPASN